MDNERWAQVPGSFFLILRIPVCSSHHETPSDASWHSSDMSRHSCEHRQFEYSFARWTVGLGPRQPLFENLSK